MLDNRRMAMIDDAHVSNIRPTFVIDQHGVMQYVDTPLLAAAPGRDLSPSAALDLAALPGLISPSN
jgi:alkyl hydroperoxide reductase subunit AhpC